MGKLYIIAYRSIPFTYLFGDEEKRENIVVIENGLAAPKNRFLQITRFLFCGKCWLPICILQLWFKKSFLMQLKEIKEDDTLLLFESINLRATGMLYHLLPKNLVKYNWFGNPIYPLFKGRNPQLCLEKIKKFGFQLVTFDPQDAIRYGMSYHNQFLRFPKSEELACRVDIDFFFAGIPKDREPYLLRIKAFLESKGYKCYFVIPHSSSEYISYEENLRYVARSRCIVDIYQKGQSGITRRPVEALFYNKKLIINNPEIRNYDFFHPNNIFILEGEDFEKIPTFMEKTVYVQSDSLKERYSVENWLSFFKEMKK